MKKEILHCAVGLLARREHSQKELLQKLQQREHQAEDIFVVITYLIEKDYLSDERFADCVFRSRIGKGYGWLYIKNELKQKGVCSNIIEQLRKNSEIDWYLQAELAYNKRFGFSDLCEFKDREQFIKEKAKRMRFLQYRGFLSDEIIAIINA